MTCSNCKHCVPNEVCNDDHKYTSKNTKALQDDSIEFYDTKESSPCELFKMAI